MSTSTLNNVEIDDTKKDGSVARTTYSYFPMDISAESLIGKFPKSEDIVMDDVLGKLTSQYTWKPMRLILTASDLLFCRPSEDILRDSVPLHEILDIKKRSDMPGKNTGAEIPNDSSNILARNSFATFFEEEAAGQLHIVQIRTVEDGQNSGRTYYLNCETAEACSAWTRALQAGADEAELAHHAGPSLLIRARRHVRRLYNHDATQFLVGGLILVSFAVNIAQAELQLPPGSDARRQADAVLDTLEIVITALFAFELALNLFAHWFWRFFSDGWCLFDLVVIALSLFALSAPDFPAITALRLVRTLRSPARRRSASRNPQISEPSAVHTWDIYIYI
jgi:hypothetical protein